MNANEHRLRKRATHIPGLDTALRGGLPRNGAVLILGAPGTGKTALALQILAEATRLGHGGVYLSFEESPEGLARDAASFDWGEELIASDRCVMLDARPPMGAASSGDFDLEGLIALVDSQRASLQAQWIVLDGLDRLLELQPDARAALDQVARLQGWCREAGVTLLLSAKPDAAGASARGLDGVEYLMDSVLVMSNSVVANRLNRRFRIAKYRGTAHATNELPLVMDDGGIHVGIGTHAVGDPAPVGRERVSTGVRRLDEVLGGGLYRGSVALLSGQPGTSKTTLAASFAAAAGARGERTLYISFDELTDRIVRNVASVGIDLQTPMDNGWLYLRPREAWRSLLEEHFVAIQRQFEALAPHCLVIDPVSALFKAASAENPHETVEALLAVARHRGITTVLTSLNETDDDSEATLSNASTLADTWITLSYNVRAGERNRALSVVKSRGSAHSNQVRELLLGDEGIDLADVYQFGSEVLMGTARLEKESEAAEAARADRLARDQRRRALEQRIAAAEARQQEAEAETRLLREELDQDERAAADHGSISDSHAREVVARRTARGGRRPDRDDQHPDGGGQRGETP